MAFNVKVFNRARQATATTGTGTVALGSASTGYLTAAEAGVVTGDIVTYVIEEGNDFEIGYGTYSSTGPTLTRDAVEVSKISGTAGTSKMNLAGAAAVALVPIAKGLTRPMTAGGRLTLATNTPVMTSNQTAKTTVYYTPYIHQQIPLWDGSAFYLADIGTELSQATTDSTKSPAAVTTNALYDVFGWADGSTIRATRGPAWSSTTSRGTGAGTTELEMVNGIWVNKVAITNGPAARYGVYLGTIGSNGSSQIDWQYGAVGGTPTGGLHMVWNMYNRVMVAGYTGDTAASWTYQSTTVRAANAQNGMRATYVCGLVEDPVFAEYVSGGTTPAATAFTFGIGVDSTTAFTGLQPIVPTSTNFSGSGVYSGTPGLGLHYLQACEKCGNATSAVTIYGNGGFTGGGQNGMQYRLMM